MMAGVEKPNIAVILFPGSNCEVESVQVCKELGMDARVLRWNEDPELLDSFDGFILPGGWSYEDRIRAGAIAAKDSIMQEIKVQAARGKPVLGICNGCQVLVETNLVPGIKKDISMAVAPNTNPFISGYYCTWVRIRPATSKKTAFNRMLDPDDVLQIPIAHGEGRFITADQDVLKGIEDKDLVAFEYCDEQGIVDNSFPTNPNGSVDNIAALVNEAGNVMAIMPHPERAFFARQVPGFKGNATQAVRPGPGYRIFASMKDYIESRKGEE